MQIVRSSLDNGPLSRRSYVGYLPTPDILGAAVVASGRDTNRVVAAHLPPTEPRGRSATLTCYGRSEAADTGSRLQSSGSSQFETLCIFDAVSQARQVAYNVVALETGQPKSPSGANEQH